MIGLTDIAYSGPGRPIDGYGPGFFRIGGVVFRGAVIAAPDGVRLWAGLTDIAPLLALQGQIDVLLLGMGAQIAYADPAMKALVEAEEIALEPMTSAFGCAQLQYPLCPRGAGLQRRCCLSDDKDLPVRAQIGYPRSMDLTVTELALARGGLAVLSGVSFRLAAGRALVLRGPNGVGKTTLLRTIAGLQAPIAGTITPGPDRIAYAAHADAVKGALSVAENLRFWARIYGVDGDRTRA